MTTDRDLRIGVGVVIAAALLLLLPVAGAETARTIRVVLDDYSIEMPSTIASGPAKLEIVNKGQAEHNIEIEGQGFTRRLEENLLPGESGTLRIDLEPGEYYVWCPVGRHEDYGMHMTLTVEADAAGTKDPAASPTADQGENASDGTPSPTPAPSPAAEKPAAREDRPVLPKHTPPRPSDLGTATGVKKLLYWLGNFHPPLISFPIALLVATAVAELLRMRTGRDAYATISRYCIRFAAVTALAAGFLGWCYAGFRFVDQTWVLTTHRYLGTGTAVLVLVVLWVAEAGHRTGSPTLVGAYRTLLFLSVALVLTTGFFGGALIYGLDHYAWW